MDQLELKFGNRAVNLIASHYKTLDRYRRTSIMANGRPTESVRTLARLLFVAVNTIGAEHRNDREVQRWRKKFNQFVEQHNLVDIESVESGEISSHGTEEEATKQAIE